jgi:hypothetical protein
MMGVIVYTTLAILIFNLIVDLLYAVIDPRVRLVRPYEREAVQLKRAGPRPVKVPATTS